jgi:hypothetical protein
MPIPGGAACRPDRYANMLDSRRQHLAPRQPAATNGGRRFPIACPRLSYVGWKAFLNTLMAGCQPDCIFRFAWFFGWLEETILIPTTLQPTIFGRTFTPIKKPNSAQRSTITFWSASVVYGYSSCVSGRKAWSGPKKLGAF